MNLVEASHETMNGLSWNGLGLRAADIWTRQLEVDAATQNTDGFRFQANSTSAFNNELEFAAAGMVRKSLVILASFNAVAAFATAAGIVWDCYTTTRKGDPTIGFRSSFWKLFGPAEVFPFTLCCGIMAQGIVFAVAQSKGLDELLILGCTSISQSVLPATLAIPFTEIIFGVETTVRASWRDPFPKRPTWATATCIATLVAALLSTYGVTLIDRASNFCSGSLFYFIAPWSLACLGIMLAAVGTSLVTAAVVVLRLRSSARIDPTQRLAASWTACFMGVAVVTNTLYVPFFYKVAFGDPATGALELWQLFMVAAVVSNLTGFVVGGMYLFLRSSRFATISPKGYFESDRQHLKKGIRIWAPSNYTYTNQMAQPVSPPAQYQRATSRQDETKQEEVRIESPTGTPTYDQPNPLALNAIRATAQTPRQPEIARLSGAKAVTSYARDSSATDTDTPGIQTLGLLPAATYIPSSVDELMMPGLLPPPPMIYGPDGSRHRRDSSMASSATVQIGLRLSNVNDMAPRSQSYLQEPSQVHDLQSPVFQTPPGSKKLSPLATNAVSARDTAGGPLGNMNAGRSHGLHSIPSETEEKAGDDEIRLSPTVYSPQSKISQAKSTAPIGVGLSTPDARPVIIDPSQNRRPDWI